MIAQVLKKMVSLLPLGKSAEISIYAKCPECGVVKKGFMKDGKVHLPLHARRTGAVVGNIVEIKRCDGSQNPGTLVTDLEVIKRVKSGEEVFLPN